MGAADAIDIVVVEVTVVYAVVVLVPAVNTEVEVVCA